MARALESWKQSRGLWGGLLMCLNLGVGSHMLGVGQLPPSLSLSLSPNLPVWSEGQIWLCVTNQSPSWNTVQVSGTWEAYSADAGQGPLTRIRQLAQQSQSQGKPPPAPNTDVTLSAGQQRHGRGFQPSHSFWDRPIERETRSYENPRKWQGGTMITEGGHSVSEIRVGKKFDSAHI